MFISVPTLKTLGTERIKGSGGFFIYTVIGSDYHGFQNPTDIFRNPFSNLKTP